MSKKNDPTSSKHKTKLSFLLNDEDESITPRTSSSSLLGSTSRQYLAPSSSFHFTPGAGPSRHPMQLAPQRTSMDVNPAYAADGSADKKAAVRKKRQRKFICSFCGFGFYTNSDMQKHISSVHLNLRPYECSMCDKRFGERSNATKHFKSVHEKQKNAACTQCDKVFAFRDGLVRHVRLVHENVRNFHCKHPGCGQSFKQSAHLKKHEQIHDKNRVMQRYRTPNKRPPSKGDGSDKTIE